MDLQTDLDETPNASIHLSSSIYGLEQIADLVANASIMGVTVGKNSQAVWRLTGLHRAGVPAPRICPVSSPNTPVVVDGKLLQGRAACSRCQNALACALDGQTRSFLIVSSQQKV